MRSARWAIGVALCALGCGGGLPLLHPAQVLPEGSVDGFVGASAQLAAGEADQALLQARENSVAGKAPPPSASADYLKGAAVAATLAPGFAPVFGGRVGLGWGSEGGLAGTGRSLRLDARKALQWGPLALSVGLGGQALLARASDDGGNGLRGLSLAAVSGYGLDVPVLVGWQGEQAAAWAGVRAGFERQRGQIKLDPDGQTPSPLDWSARRWWGGGVVGGMAGYGRVFLAVELDVAFHDVTAQAAGSSTAFRGLSLAPASAIRVRF